jgi:hypothetical protein
LKLSRSLCPLVIALTFAACATQPPPPPLTPPAWEAVPAGVLDVLCSRLQIDAIASTAQLAIVETTRPLATAEAMSALARSGRGNTSSNRLASSAADANRALPVTTEGSSCSWRPIAASEIRNTRDEMLVELSAPMLHPFLSKQAGLFARASVGGEGASWYWITLVPYGEGWRVVSLTVLVQ